MTMNMRMIYINVRMCEGPKDFLGVIVAMSPVLYITSQFVIFLYIRVLHKYFDE